MSRTTSERVDRLRAVPLFAALDARTLEQLARAVSDVEIPAGQIFIEPNTKGSGMFVIEAGTVAVETRGRQLELGPGEFVGELALLNSHGNRIARVRAKTDVRCLALSRADFVAALEANPKLALALLEALAARLEGAEARRR